MSRPRRWRDECLVASAPTDQCDCVLDRRDGREILRSTSGPLAHEDPLERQHRKLEPIDYLVNGARHLGLEVRETAHRHHHVEPLAQLGPADAWWRHPEAPRDPDATGGADCSRYRWVLGIVEP